MWLNSYFCSENFKIGLDIPGDLVYYIPSTQIHWKKEDIMEYNPALPIYLQVMTAIKHDIVAGRLALGEKMPSVRDLAIQYTINPNTAGRVYKELESEGVCFTRRGMGTFVTEDEERIKQMKEEMAGELISQFLGGMRRLGISGEEAIELVGRYQAKKDADGGRDG